MIIKQNDIIEDIRESLDSNKKYLIKTETNEIEILEIIDGKEQELNLNDSLIIENLAPNHKFKKKG